MRSVSLVSTGSPDVQTLTYCTSVSYAGSVLSGLGGCLGATGACAPAGGARWPGPDAALGGHRRRHRRLRVLPSAHGCTSRPDSATLPTRRAGARRPIVRGGRLPEGRQHLFAEKPHRRRVVEPDDNDVLRAGVSQRAVVRDRAGRVGPQPEVPLAERAREGLLAGLDALAELEQAAGVGAQHGPVGPAHRPAVLPQRRVLAAHVVERPGAADRVTGAEVRRV